MRVILFDGNNCIDVSRSDYMTEEESERLDEWLDNECQHSIWRLEQLQIEDDKWVMFLYDEDEDEEYCIEI